MQPGNLERPICSRCRVNGYMCRYDTKKKRPGPRKGSGRSKTEAMASRLRYLEALLQRVQSHPAFGQMVMLHDVPPLQEAPKPPISPIGIGLDVGPSQEPNHVFSPAPSYTENERTFLCFNTMNSWCQPPPSVAQQTLISTTGTAILPPGNQSSYLDETRTSTDFSASILSEELKQLL
jgi:hypothetical protein